MTFVPTHNLPHIFPFKDSATSPLGRVSFFTSLYFHVIFVLTQDLPHIFPPGDPNFVALQRLQFNPGNVMAKCARSQRLNSSSIWPHFLGFICVHRGRLASNASISANLGRGRPAGMMDGWKDQNFETLKVNHIRKSFVIVDGDRVHHLRSAFKDVSQKEREFFLSFYGSNLVWVDFSGIKSFCWQREKHLVHRALFSNPFFYLFFLWREKNAPKELFLMGRLKRSFVFSKSRKFLFSALFIRFFVLLFRLNSTFFFWAEGLHGKERDRARSTEAQKEKFHHHLLIFRCQGRKGDIGILIFNIYILIINLD